MCGPGPCGLHGALQYRRDGAQCWLAQGETSEEWLVRFSLSFLSLMQCMMLQALQGASTFKPENRCGVDAATFVYRWVILKVAHPYGVTTLAEGGPLLCPLPAAASHLLLRPPGLLHCSARRPFHPGRLHAFITQHFVLQQPHWENDCAGEGSNHSHGDALHNHEHGDGEPYSHGQARSLQQAVLQASAAAAQAAAAMHSLTQQATAGGSHASSPDQGLLAAAAAATSAAAAAATAAALIVSQLSKPGGEDGSLVETTLQPAISGGRGCAHHPLVCVSPAEAARRSSRLAATFGQLVRSRGLIWLATRPSLYGEWSQVGG